MGHFVYNKKIYKYYLVKMLYKNSCVNFDAFSKQNGSFIFPQNRGAQSKSVKTHKVKTKNSTNIEC